MAVWREFALWAALTSGTVLAAAWRGPKHGACKGAVGCTLDLLHDEEYRFRCVMSLPIACLVYLACASAANALFPRTVIERGARPPVYSWWRFDTDINWSLVGVLAGTPMIQLFHRGCDKYGTASGMRLYKDPLEHGLAWAILQLPIYLILWDLTFYLIHRFVLHGKWTYRYLHSSHHAYRPPTAWSGIAVGPLDVAFEGILPYTLPLFCGLPFHEGTVYAVNALLTFHACVLHSSCHRDYAELHPLLGWLLISPIGHNMHHNYGERNACNFAPIFKIFDRAFGTLNQGEPFWWESDRKAAKLKAATKAG